ncbi:MAG: GDSL-type esterase/lipase family protein [Saprospiraceae bacterium]
MSKTILIISLFGNALSIIVAWFVIQRFGGLDYIFYRFNNPEVISNQVHRRSILNHLKIDSTDIIMLGNSLTAYAEWSEILENPSFKNRGIPGETLEGVRQRIPTILESKPSKLFLMIGINDLMYHDADWVLKKYENVLEEIYPMVVSTDLVIQEILPVNEKVQSLTTNNTEIQKVNAGLKLLAEKYKLSFLPLFDRFLDTEGQLKSSFTSDGVHLNAAAYEVWKNALQDFMSAT